MVCYPMTMETSGVWQQNKIKVYLFFPDCHVIFTEVVTNPNYGTVGIKQTKHVVLYTKTFYKVYLIFNFVSTSHHMMIFSGKTKQNKTKQTNKQKNQELNLVLFEHKEHIWDQLTF